MGTGDQIIVLTCLAAFFIWLAVTSFINFLCRETEEDVRRDFWDSPNA